MPTPFPGMDPYLERPGMWEEVHTRLIVAIADTLGPQVRPNYRVGVEQRTYLAVLTPDEYELDTLYRPLAPSELWLAFFDKSLDGLFMVCSGEAVSLQG